MRIKRLADAEPEPTRHTNITIKNKSLEEIRKEASSLPLDYQKITYSAAVIAIIPKARIANTGSV